MIREAVATDSETLESLYKLLVPTSRNIHVLPERMEQIIADSNNFLFVYEENGQILGTVFLTLCMCPAYEFRPYGIVEYVFVREEARGSGIGKSLLDHVEQICVSKHCTYIGLMSNAQRENAHRFFESRGYNGTMSKGFKKYIKVRPVDWNLEISE
ncbi:GNAT family N-acetyltransferase [Paenibacillus sp. WQ 127069]|uniref:GNAT family N-acetyltransferase n=1 Tax=Paenibacillus baimaensis TaxID=2982185 RepID=A0ABT2UJQ3_9BACL|nr:GNAT family N-acetyltransferase [Paenibacillus sp. WQ 127069]MCU6794848.1 GNAT family N-acetyltransferase [Paenibacillus sp. WQ 127069]